MGSYCNIGSYSILNDILFYITGILVTSNISWSTHVTAVCFKANRLLGYIRRCSIEITNLTVRRTLYLTLVRSMFSHASQLWVPQQIKYVSLIERVQRRATKFLLNLPFRTNVPYQERLQRLEMLPITYWHEIQDLTLFFRILRGDVFITTEGLVKIKQPARTTRQHNSQSGTLISIRRCRTAAFQNSYFVRTGRVWNCLTVEERDLSQSVMAFKRKLNTKYQQHLRNIYDPDNPITFKTVCVKCHSARNLGHLNIKACCF